MKRRNTKKGTLVKRSRHIFAMPIAAVLVALLLGACSGTRYVEFDQELDNTQVLFRTVAVDVAPEFRDEFPDCVVVMPPLGGRGSDNYSGVIEAALAAHLTKKINRVVVSIERDAAMRRLAINVNQDEDLRALASALECDALITSEILITDKKYFLVWSQLQIGLVVKMTRMRDGQLLWRARHVADRSEGGLPLSVFGAAVEAYSSTKLTMDEDVTASVVDDAVRRLVASLPDAKSF
jgi:hypothetical protein